MHFGLVMIRKNVILNFCIEGKKQRKHNVRVVEQMVLLAASQRRITG